MSLFTNRAAGKAAIGRILQAMLIFLTAAHNFTFHA
jgi:hypothetical protein